MNKVIVFCNNRMALPAIQILAQHQILSGIGIPDTNTELEQECRHFFGASNISIQKLEQKTLTEVTLNWLQTTQSHYVLLMTFPWKIPASLLNTLPNKFINFHYGLLPQMRGADPIFESIRRQFKETGITIHIVTSEIDKGPILITQKILLDKHITHGLLCTRMANLAAQMSQQLMHLLNQTNLPDGEVQSEHEAMYYNRANLNDVIINWQTMDSKSIDALIRACNPWNKGAYTSHGNWNFRIIAVTDAGQSDTSSTPGTISRGENNECHVHCKDNRKLNIAIIHSEEGFFEGNMLFEFGIISGNYLN